MDSVCGKIFWVYCGILIENCNIAGIIDIQCWQRSSVSICKHNCNARTCSQYETVTFNILCYSACGGRTYTVVSNSRTAIKGYTVDCSCSLKSGCRACVSGNRSLCRVDVVASCKGTCLCTNTCSTRQFRSCAGCFSVAVIACSRYAVSSCTGSMACWCFTINLCLYSGGNAVHVV